MTENEPNTEQRQRQHAALYFDAKNSKAFKELAGRIRSEGGRTTLIWSDRWNGPENMLMEARAVVIQQGCDNANEICDAYRKYAHDVEIHFADENGEFPEDDGRTEMEKTADEEAQASREERGATKEDDEAALAEEVATDVAEDENPESEDDAIVQAETEDADAGEDDSDGDSDDDSDGEDDSDEEGSEKSSDS
jgi:hypothetical protein